LFSCSDVDPSGTEPQKLGAQHVPSSGAREPLESVDNDCHQYEVAQQMRYHEPRVANSESH